MRLATRALIGVWSIVLLLLAGGALVLQWLGPPLPVLHPGSAALPARPAAASPRPGIPAADPALLQPAADFPGRFLPVKGADGGTAAQRYRARTELPAHRPPVAVLLDGVGLDGGAAEAALVGLPAAISLAVSPYAAVLARPEPPPLLEEFRKRGHELWLSLPMEPGPVAGHADDEGDWARRRSAERAANERALEWSLSRFTGYVGLTDASDGLFGEGFADDPSFALVSDTLLHRGLLYLEGGSGRHDGSAVPPPGSSRRADLVLDGRADAASIDDRLRELDALATSGTGTRTGMVIVAGPATGTLVERLRLWSAGLDRQGLVLVPVSALMPGIVDHPPAGNGARTPPEGAHPS